jgi:hypothetical protein
MRGDYRELLLVLLGMLFAIPIYLLIDYAIWRREESKRQRGDIEDDTAGF